MRAGSDTQIISVAPVDEVVARFLPWGGMVRDFVCGHAGCGHAGLRHLVEFGRGVDVKFAHRAARQRCVERRAFFKRQLIKRVVGAALGDRSVELFCP